MELNRDAMKHVFEALDTNSSGFISVDQFVHAFENFESTKELRESFDANNLRKIYQQKQQLQNWIETLDPQNDGKIYFDDFISGIHKLIGSDSTDSCENDLTRNDTKSPPKPLCFLTDDEKFSTEDSGVHSAIYDIAVKRDTEDTDSVLSRESSIQSDYVTRREPNLEFRGTLSNGAEGLGHLLHSDGLKQEHLRPPSSNGSLTRGGEIRSTWPKRHVYSCPGDRKRSIAPSVGPDLNSHESFHGSVSSLNGSCHDLLYKDLDTSFTVLQDQYRRLEEKFDSLNSLQSESHYRETRLKEENQNLVKRLMALEDHFREFNDKSKDNFNEERRQLQEKINRLNRDSDSEHYCLKMTLNSLEVEMATAKQEVAKYQAETERQKLELAKAKTRESDLEVKIETLQSEVKHYREKAKHEVDLARNQRDQANSLLEELNREASQLRSLCYGQGGPSSNLGEDSLSSRFREAEELVTRISRENKHLREQLEEVQEELLSRSLEDGRSLVKKSEVSLASELDDYSKDEIMDLLVKEKEANFALREYVEKIITRVLEQYPSLLEINN